MWHPTVGSLFVRSSSVEQGGVSRHGTLSCGNLPSCRCLTRGRPPVHLNPFGHYLSRDGLGEPEQLWSAKTARNVFEVESIAPQTDFQSSDGRAVGVAAGSRGGAAFFSDLKQPKAIARLQDEGFEMGRAASLGPDYQKPDGAFD